MRITVSMLLMVLVLLLCSTIKTISLTSAAAAAAELNPTWTGQTGSWRPRLASSHIKLNLSLTQKCAMLLKRFFFSATQQISQNQKLHTKNQQYFFLLSF